MLLLPILFALFIVGRAAILQTNLVCNYHEDFTQVVQENRCRKKV